MKKILKSIGSALKSSWNYIDGRKRNIGIATFLIGMGLNAFNITPQDQGLFIQTIGGLVGGFGWAHSVLKDKKTTDKVNDIINTAKANKNK